MSEDRTRDAVPDAVPFAARHGVVRPLQGRYVAGVCAALARATRTDPVLWRVALAVLVCFAGVGALIYLLVWLLSPEEGDTASPLEALLGRGRSNTSPVVTAVLGLIAAGLLIYILPRPLYVVLGGAVVLAVVLLINKTRSDPVPAPQPLADPPLAPPPAEPVAEPLADAVPPPAAVPTSPPPTPAGPAAAIGYRPPFAPHGPYAPPPLPPPPRPPPVPRERSALPAIVFFSSLVALGVLGMLDLTGAVDVPVSGYLAGGLTVIGAGLVVGAWLGRARPLIALGTVLALALPAAHAMEVWDRPQYVADDFHWRPASTAEIEDEYSLMFGEGELDLRQVDFTGQDVEIMLEVTFGQLRVVVPADVAVEASTYNRFSSTTVFGESSDGITQDTFRDPGSGDPADGLLRLDLRNRFGNLEVVGR
jgi:phage shock protein PspC (stress-responsive transcriptional regulator)